MSSSHLHQQSTFRGMAAPLIWLVAGNVPVIRLWISFTIRVPSHVTSSNPPRLEQVVPSSHHLADIQPLHGQHWQNTHCSVPFECHYVIRRHYILEYRLFWTHPVCKLMQGKLGACLCSITVQFHYLSLLLSFTTSTMPPVFQLATLDLDGHVRPLLIQTVRVRPHDLESLVRCRWFCLLVCPSMLLLTGPGVLLLINVLSVDHFDLSSSH